MPSASGVYSLPAGYLATTGQTILASQHNPPLEDIATALTGRLSRDGTAPMTGAVQGVAGAVATPSYTFATDASTGIYKTTSGIGVSVSGTKVAEFTSAGLASGVWIPGMVIPYAGRTAPNSLWVLPVGQTLSRTTYAQLWAVAQVEIAAGSTFYTNGDGSTTFGIGDLRGRTISAIDNMGGSDASRLTGGALSAVRTTVGGAAGESAHTLTLSELPTGITSTGSNSIIVASTNGLTGIPTTTAAANVTGANAVVGAGIVVPASSSASWAAVNSLSGTNTINVTSNNTSGAVHNNVQPTMLCTFILFAGGA